MRIQPIYPRTCRYGATAFVCLLVFFASCSKKNDQGSPTVTGGDTTVTPQPTLLDYKNGAHHLFVGYLVADGNDPVAGYNPANAPDSVDFLEFFSGYDTSRADWRIAQAKGTRIVICHFIKDAYFDGSINDPATQDAGYVVPTGFDQYNATSTSTYTHWAQDVYNKEIVGMGLNGIDIDIESGTFGGDVPRVAANGTAVLTALAKYFGPNCTACTVDTNGRKPVFFYDTDGTSGFENTMYTANKSNYDYVLFQSYTTGSHGWSGTGTSGFSKLVATYGLDKLIFLVNGDSFTYPNGTEDVAGGDTKATTSLYSYADWVKTNNGVGVGTYRMSRDYNHTPSFGVSREAIQRMNPAQ